MYMSDGTNDSGVCSASRGLSRDTCYITETEVGFDWCAHKALSSMLLKEHF